jgi:hypothetical protein
MASDVSMGKLDAPEYVRSSHDEDGACGKVGDLRAEPYAADYIFLKRTSP